MKNVNHDITGAINTRESHLSKKYDTKLQKSPYLRFSLSLAISLLLVYLVFQIKTPKEIVLAQTVETIEDDMVDVPIVRVEEELVKELKPEPKIEKQILYDKVKEDDEKKKVAEKVLITEPPKKQVTKLTNTDKVKVIDESELDPIETLPIDFVKVVPIFPGCEKKKTNAERKKCLSKKIDRHINRKFNKDLVSDLELEGVQRIYVQFTIDEYGKVVDVESRGPHPKLEKEALKTINKLPIMTPGKQSDEHGRKKNVRVKYTLPIKLKVN